MNYKAKDRALVVICVLATILPLTILVVLIGDVLIDGIGRVSVAFLEGFPSRKPDVAGVKPGLVGSALLVMLTASVAVPLGIGTAIYLQEYGEDTWWRRLVATNISSLAGVPSVIYGLLGLGVFVQMLGMGRSLIAGALTLALLILPVVVISSLEALRAVPDVLREAAYGLGATRWQVVRHVVLPSALPAILTGCILSVGRAIGETAPLIVVGALTFVTFTPDGIDAPFTALPIQIYSWVGRPQAGFQETAAAGIVVLLALLLVINLGAIILRARLTRSR